MKKKVNNLRVIFNLPENILSIDVMREILKSNHLEESDEEFFSKRIKGIEPRLLIIKDAATTMTQKKIPEKKLAELLEKHLEVKKHVAENIVKEINEKLIPYAKIIDEEKEEKLRKHEEDAQRQKEEAEEERKKEEEEIEEAKKEAFAKAKDELMERIGVNAPQPEPEPEKTPSPNLKQPEIADVEKNAENMDEEGNNITTKEKNATPGAATEEKPAEPEKKITDPYKEPIE